MLLNFSCVHSSYKFCATISNASRLVGASVSEYYIQWCYCQLKQEGMDIPIAALNLPDILNLQHDRAHAGIIVEREKPRSATTMRRNSAMRTH